MINAIDIIELYSWFSKERTRTKIVDRIGDLINHLGNTSSYTEYKNYVFNSMMDIDIFSLNQDKLFLLKKVGVLRHFGENGVGNITGIFSEYGTDEIGIKEKLSEIKEDILDGYKQIEKISDLLSVHYGEENENTKQTGIPLYIHFVDSYDIKNTSQLSFNMTQLNMMLDLIAKANKIRVEDIRLSGVRKGSIVLELMSDNLEFVYLLLKIVKKTQEIIIELNEYVEAHAVRYNSKTFGTIDDKKIDELSLFNTARMALLDFIKREGVDIPAKKSFVKYLWDLIYGGVIFETLKTTGNYSQDRIDLLNETNCSVKKNISRIETMKLIENQ